MFRRRTLFVVGAGASCEARLPIGTQLANTIAKKLTPKEDTVSGGVTNFDDRELYRPLLRHSAGINDFVKAAYLINRGVRLSSSIDDFLNIHRKNAQVLKLGKAAIVRSILEAERSSILHIDPSNTYNQMNLEGAEDT